MPLNFPKKRKPSEKEMTGQVITSSVLNFLGYMPNPDDIATGTFDSYETYRKMKTDPKIKSLLGKIKSGALNFPLHIVQGDSSDEVYSFITGLDIFRNMAKKNRRMLTALDYGFSVSELVWKRQDGRWIPDTFITRRPERFRFTSNWELQLTDAGATYNLNQQYKWLILQHEPDDENPYGTSILRCVYWAWLFKQAGYDFWLQATEKFSVKSLLALFKMEGNEQKIQERAHTIAEMLLGVMSGSAGAISNVEQVVEVGMTGQLADFRQMVDACDLQISYGLTGQSVATSNTNGGSLALGEVQADLLYEDCKSVAQELQTLLQKIIDWAVELNFGPGQKVPQIEFDVDRRATFDQLMQAIDRKVPVSRSALYSYYGLPKPRNEDDAYIREDESAINLSDLPPKSQKKNFRFF